MSLPKNTQRIPTFPANGGKKKRKEGNSRLGTAGWKIKNHFNPEVNNNHFNFLNSTHKIFPRQRLLVLQ